MKVLILQSRNDPNSFAVCQIIDNQIYLKSSGDLLTIASILSGSKTELTFVKKHDLKLSPGLPPNILDGYIDVPKNKRPAISQKFKKARSS